MIVSHLDSSKIERCAVKFSKMFLRTAQYLWWVQDRKSVKGGAKKVLVPYGKCVKNIAVPYGSQAKKVFVPYMKQMQLVIAYCSWGSGGAVSLPVGPGQFPGGLLESFRVKVI